MIIDYLFLPMLFLIGAVTSYQDFHFGKIKNKWIVLGLAWGISIYALFIIWDLGVFVLSKTHQISVTTILPSYIFNALANFAIAVVIGYLLWYFDVWAAGDAKLFFVFALLLPLKYYWRSALAYFPSVALLINIFISVIAFLFLASLYGLLIRAIKAIRGGISRQEIIGSLKQAKIFIWSRKKQIIIIIFGAFLMSFLFQLIRIKLGGAGGQDNWSVAIFLLMNQSMRYFNMIFSNKWGWLLLFFLIAAICILWLNSFLAINDFVKTAFLMKNSLILTPIFLIVSALLMKMPNDKSKELLPFALWMFVGVLITIIFQGSIINFFLKR